MNNVHNNILSRYLNRHSSYYEFDYDGRILVNLNGCLKDGAILTLQQCPNERNIVSLQLHNT